MRLLFKWWMVLIGIPCLLVIGSSLLIKMPDMPYAVFEWRYAPRRSNFIDLPSGARIHFRDQGNPQGRALLLIHGFGVSLESWESWVQVLSAEYRLVSFDLPGHGLTRVPKAYEPSPTRFADLSAELAAQLGLEKYTVIGNSLGGHVAWQLALRHATNVEALVLVDAAGWYDSAPLKYALWAARFIGDRMARFLAQLNPKPAVRIGLRMAFADSSLVTKSMVDRYSDMALGPGHRELLRKILRSLTGEELASDEKLANIRAPTLILWGERDRLIPVRDAQKFKRAIAGSTAVTYPRVGHLPQEEAVEASAQTLKTFLDALPEQRGGTGAALSHWRVVLHSLGKLWCRLPL